MITRSIIKYIQSLQQKKFRDEYNAFIAEGPKVVNELLAANTFTCRSIYATAPWIANYNSGNDIKAKITEVTADELLKISALQTPNLVVAEFQKRSNSRINEADLKHAITLALEDIRDPGNMGTIIRIADWFGVRNIICSDETVDIYNPKVVQSTMASLGRVNVIYTSLENFIKESAIPKYAAVLDGNPVQSLGKVKEGILVIGNESKGISESLLQHVQHRVCIPGNGSAESLNAGVATGILLYAMINGTV